MKFSKAIEGFTLSLASDSYSPITISNYKRFLTQFSDYLGNPEVERIHADHVRAYLTHLQEEGKAGATVQVHWKCIRSFYNWASIVLLVQRPDSTISAPKFQSEVIVPFTHEELEKMSKACISRRDKALILLLLDTGLRASEAARLTIRDTSIETGTVLVRPFGRGAKSKSRQVYLGASARKAFWVYLASRKDGADLSAPLLSTRNGGFLDRFQILNIVKRIAARAEVNDAHPHKFRHTFAIEYLRNGGDVFTLQRLLGHSSLEMVRIYLDLADSDAESAHKRASPADRLRL